MEDRLDGEVTGYEGGGANQKFEDVRYENGGRTYRDAVAGSGLEDSQVCVRANRYIGGLKVLLTFNSTTETKAFVKEKKDLWSSRFRYVEIWDGQCVEYDRVAWVKIHGVPVHLWDAKVFDDGSKVQRRR
ncbi:hypothetical protein R6Q57_009425 [Mikania cordata]